MDNIDDLVDIRNQGSMTGRRRATPVFNVIQVRLDIFVPKGYNKANLIDVVNHARRRNVSVNIIRTQ